VKESADLKQTGTEQNFSLELNFLRQDEQQEMGNSREFNNTQQRGSQ